MEENTRKLATIRRVAELKPIEGADKIELAIVDGWQVVVKKDEHKVNDLVVYLEVDSWVPHTLAPFLTKNYPKVYKGIEGNRLKTIKLRGELSQGLILPLNIHAAIEDANDSNEGEDVTEILGILKWEKEIPAQLAGIMRGSFPTAIPKTDQERIQNLTKRLAKWNEDAEVFEVTEKLEGSSCTFYMDMEGVFHVCSRNVDLKFDENNSFWKMALTYQIEKKFRLMGDLANGLAVQGELVGPGIQGNIYDLPEVDFYVFDMYHEKMHSYCDVQNRHRITEYLGLKHAPLKYPYVFCETTLEELLEMADGNSELGNNTAREGLVFKSLRDPSITFKVISNKYLLSEK